MRTPSRISGNAAIRVPIVKEQAKTVAIFADPGTTHVLRDLFVIRWAFLVRPSVDLRRIRRAFDRLVARHDTLRLRFFPEAGSWSAEIVEAHPQGVQVHDLGDVADEVFDAEVQGRAKAAIPIDSDTLFEVHVLRFGARGDVVLFRVHHAIVDGYGAMVLAEEFFKLLMNIPLLSRPVSHIDSVKLDARRSRQNAAAKSAFWKNMVEPFGPLPQIGQQAKGKTPVHQATSTGTVLLKDVCSSDDYAVLTKRAQQVGVTPFSLLQAAFGDMICAAGGVNTVLLWSFFGRAQAELLHYIGAATTSVPLKYAADGAARLEDRAKSMTGLIKEAAAHLPCADLVGDGALSQAFAAAGVPRLQYITHLLDPQGRMRSSDITGHLTSLKRGAVSFGQITVERLRLDPQPSTPGELQLTVEDTPNGYAVTFGANAEAFSQADLVDLSADFRARLAWFMQ